MTSSFPQINYSTLVSRYYPPLIAVAIGLLCLWGMWNAGRAGVARLFSIYRGSPALTNKVANLSPSDPEVRFGDALALWRAGQHDEAIKHLEWATALRPRHYHLWLELGRMRSLAGDQQGALAAFREALRRAPYYAQPRWQLGNLLLNMKRRDEAFAELRPAAASDPKLFPAIIDLAWDAYAGDARAVKEAVQPQTTATQLALARFFANQGETIEAANLFHAAGDAADQDRHRLLKDLVDAKRFSESYTLWASGRDDRNGMPQSGLDAVTDGGFETEIDADEPGFGWQLARNVATVRASRDNNEPGSGTHSLRVDWNGASHPWTSVVSQLVLVEPKMRYRLSFMTRTEKVVTGGLPVVTVIDANRDGQTLAQTEPLPSDTSGWQKHTVELVMSNETHAVRISIQRQSCASEHCPIFGRVWFDAFSLQKLS
ncbi:MAG: tetratricopeptide repeat protein [Pyrinomonadaceae bacterium]|nr:tetratricopeptide repeat protein [Pyrinomonadaceae bacterium]